MKYNYVRVVSFFFLIFEQDFKKRIIFNDFFYFKNICFNYVYNNNEFGVVVYDFLREKNKFRLNIFRLKEECLFFCLIYCDVFSEF